MVMHKGKIKIKIIEKEKTDLNPSSNVKAVSGAGNLQIINPSESHRLWNLVMNLEDTMMTENLNKHYKNNALEPNSIWNFDYQIANLKKPILDINEEIDVSRDEEGINHNLVLQAKNNVKIRIVLKNISEAAIQGLEITKELPGYLHEIKIENNNLGMTDLNIDTRMLNWKIPSLSINGEAIIELGARADIFDSNYKSGNDIKVSYKSDMATRSGIIPTVIALTDTMTGVDSDEDDSEPGVWNCQVEFENESDFELTIDDLIVDQKIVTGEDQIVHIEPDVIVAPRQTWTHDFKVHSVNVPVLTPKITFTANYDVETEIQGTIVKEASTFNVLETKVAKEINPPQVKANANTHINITDTITNVGTAIIDKVNVRDQIPRDFEVPDITQINVQIVDGAGTVVTSLHSDKASFNISPNDKELCNSHDIAMEFFGLEQYFLPKHRLIITYPLIARNPQPTVNYETPVSTIAYTNPRGSGFEQTTPSVPKIGIAYVKRNIKTAKSISPSGIEGVFSIKIKITNKGGVELQNLSIKEIVPPGFKAVDFKPEELNPTFIEGEDGIESQLIWKVDVLNPGNMLKLSYNCEGVGDFPRHEPVVEVAETESMKGLAKKPVEVPQPECEEGDVSMEEMPSPPVEPPAEPSIKIINEADNGQGPDSRLICPNCGSKKISTKEDRTNPIAYMASTPIYGKKNYCKDCGWEWK